MRDDDTGSSSDSESGTDKGGPIVRSSNNLLEKYGASSFEHFDSIALLFQYLAGKRYIDE